MTHGAAGAVLHQPKDRGDGVVKIHPSLRISGTPSSLGYARARRSQASSLRDDPEGWRA
jgi:hypothetical protein